MPKRALNKDELAAYRRRPIDASENRALGACAAFRGDVLIVESEHDDVVPHPVIANYMAAFERVSCTRFPWTPICPTGDRHGGLQHGPE